MRSGHFLRRYLKKTFSLWRVLATNLLNIFFSKFVKISPKVIAIDDKNFREHFCFVFEIMDQMQKVAENGTSDKCLITQSRDMIEQKFITLIEPKIEF